jgi:hypothetical protein
MAQGKRSLTRFQLPEPWVGQLDVAPILFVSSNPSIGKDAHATGSSTRDQVWDSHHLAFGGGSRPYIVDGVKTTDLRGRPIKRVRYWSSIRARAGELMPDREVRPGTDYALTEVVHCKTEGEYGVTRAADTCYKLHMDEIWSVAKAARVIVVFGKIARERILGLGEVQPAHPIQRDLAGLRRTIVFLPHPNARGVVKSMGENYPGDIVQLRKVLR